MRYCGACGVPMERHRKVKLMWKEYVTCPVRRLPASSHLLLPAAREHKLPRWVHDKSLEKKTGGKDE